jgi:hypothetical protein
MKKRKGVFSVALSTTDRAGPGMRSWTQTAVIGGAPAGLPKWGWCVLSQLCPCLASSNMVGHVHKVGRGAKGGSLQLAVGMLFGPGHSWAQADMHVREDSPVQAHIGKSPKYSKC